MAALDTEVCIVGAGLAGLACARALHAAGIDVRVFEASDGVGGRVRTDVVDGFRVDRGFQIVLTAYPELARQLDVDALDLRTFDAGALVRRDGTFHRVGDPVRQPEAVLSTVRAPIGTIRDKLRVLGLAVDLRRTAPRALLRRPDRTVRASLEARGFSAEMIDALWQPLLAGILLDPSLEGSARKAEVILAMLARGRAAVPGAGMGAIPDQLAAPIAHLIELDARVTSLTGSGVRFGDRLVDTRAVVVATEAPVAHALAHTPDPGVRAVANVQFACAEAPVADRLVVLDGDSGGPVTNAAVMTNVAPGYSSDGRALVSVEVPGPWRDTDAALVAAVRAQLRGWWGGAVDGWDVVATRQIAYGHPWQPPGFPIVQAVRAGDGRYVCGDHRDTATIQGALYSGRRTAAAVLADFGNS